MPTFVAKNKSHKVMSVRSTSYQQVHDLYELCSDGRSLQDFCRMSGVSYQKYMEWQRNQALSESSKKAKASSEPTMGVVTIPDAPVEQLSPKTNDRPIRDLNVRLANGTYISMHHVGLEESISMLRKILS